MTATKHSPRLFQGFLSFAPCAPSSRAHAFTPSPLDDLPLSSCLPAATMRFPSRFILARARSPPLPPCSTRAGGPRGVPGVVSSSHPLFHPRTAPARPGDVPLAHPACSPSASLTSRPADALSVPLRSTRHPPPSSPFSSHHAAPQALASSLACYPLFFSFPLFY